jgi:hypothetical protein
MNENPFQAGGPLLADSSVYIPREADRKAAIHLSRMEYVTLVEPRQHGKTSLINRLIGQFSTQGYFFAYRDLMADRSLGASPDDWYASLGKRLLRQLRFIPRDQRPQLPADSASWEDFLADVAERAEITNQNVVIVLDEIGAIPVDLATDFFSIIRSVYASRQNLPFWQRLTFVIAGAFNPKDLIQDKVVSNFNVDQRILLDDFNLSQVWQLVVHLGLPGDLTDAVAERVYYWTDGQPYLCQRICVCLAEQQVPVTVTAVDGAVERIFHEDTHHLSRVKDLTAEPDLMAYTWRITSEPRSRFNAALNDRHFRLAHIVGVIKTDPDGRCQIRNRIYERALAEVGVPPRHEPAVSQFPRGEDERVSLSFIEELSYAPHPIRDRWILLVGVNRYIDPAIHPLNFGVNDVLALGELLKTLNYTVLALHDGAPEERLLPTRDNVLAALTQLSQAIGPNDLLWVHFSCHGKPVNGQPMLITRETRAPTLARTALPLAEVEQLMRDSHAHRLVLTLDACHTGVEIGRDLADPEFVRNAYEGAEGFALIAASTAQQIAQEWKKQKHGVFTYYLLQGLSGQADHADKGFVTVDDLRTYVLDSLRRWNVEHGGLLQEPTARTEGLGDIILADYRVDGQGGQR